jgi:Na+/melibiose symporter-like transporter
MKVVVVVLCFQSLPFAVLTSAVSGRARCRRSRFWLRLIAVAVVMVLPDLAAILMQADEQAAGVLLWIGFVWGLMVAAAAAFLLFHWEGPDPGPGDDGGGGPDSGDTRPTPPPPIGGIPLPDAEPSSTRLRDHRPLPRAPRPRRPSRRRTRVPSRLSRSQLRPS